MATGYTALPASSSSSGGWTRPSDWLPMPSVTSSDQKFVGLYAIFPDVFSTGVRVTFTDATDLVNLPQHGLYNGCTVRFTTINSTTGISINTNYYVINASLNAFNVAASPTGATIALTTDGNGIMEFSNANNFAAVSFTTSSGTYTVDWGDGSTPVNVASNTTAEYTYNFSYYDQTNTTLTSLGYKQAIITVTPTTANLTAINLQVIATTVPTQSTMATGFLDCTLSIPNCTSSGITIGGTIATHYYIERFTILNSGGCTNMNTLFRGCSSLRSVPLFNTSAITSMSSMFQSCTSLQSVPLFNTSAVTNMSQMFQSCASLQSVPLFNTSGVTNMQSMFNSCGTLQSVPLFNTSAVTNMSSMFNACGTLQSVPLFNTSAVTNMSSMFQSCTSLQSVPLFNTSAVTSSMSAMLQGCNTLNDCPIIIRRTCDITFTQLNQSALQNVFNNLITVTTAQTLTITSSWGASGAVTSNSCTTTAGSNVITTVNTTGLTVGMQVTGTNTPLTTAIAVTFTDSTDTVDLTAHGLSNGDEVSFATIVTTTGISINTIYYVVNATANDFQVSLTFGGAAIALTSNGTGTLRYRASITSIVAGTSVTMNKKMTGSGTQNLIFRNLQTGTALMKGWTITG